MSRRESLRTIALIALSVALLLTNVPMVGAADVDLRNEVEPGKPNIYHVGDTIQYKLTVRNTNQNEVIVDVWDDLPNGAREVLATDLTLAPGEEKVFSASYLVSRADIITLSGGKKGVTNFLCIKGVIPAEEDEFTGTAQKSSVIIQPELDVATTVDFNKDATFSEKEANYEGESATWRVVIANSGDSAVSDIIVTDTNDHIYPTFSLDAGESRTFEFNEPITAPKMLTAIASGKDVLGAPVGPVSDPAEVETFRADIGIAKTVDFDHDGIYSERENGFDDTDADWKIVVTNCGDLDLFDVNVTDTNGRTFHLDSLPVKQSHAFTYSSVVTVDDVNVASVTARDSRERVVGPKQDEASVHVLQPGILLEKDAAPGIILEDERVTYTYKVTNKSEFPLDSVLITDDHLGVVGTIPGPLQPNESASIDTSAVIQNDTVNIGTATGTYTVSEGVTRNVVDDDDATVNVIHPSVRLDKTSDAPAPVRIGSVVTYTYKVTNTGDVRLIDLAVNDDKIGAIGTVPSLDVGASASLTATAAIFQDTINVGTVEGTDEYQHRVTDDDDELVETIIPMPDLEILKAADVETSTPGALVTYTLTYRNVGTGSTTNGYAITDDFDERYMTVENAAGGVVADGKITWLFADDITPADAPRTLTYTLRVSEQMPVGITSLDNVAVISTTGDINTANNQDDDSVDVDNPFLPFQEEEEPDKGEEPFLPFTGGQLLVLGTAIAFFGAGGLSLRRVSKR